MVHAVFVDVVLDQLEDVGIGRQREHAHHHPLDAGRDVERVARMGQVMQEVAVEQRLALLLQADHGVELGLGLARQQAGQEVHHRGRRFHVDQEVGAGEAEQGAQVVRAQQQGIQPDLAGRIARERHGERIHRGLIDQAADDVGALVAEEQRTQRVDLAIAGDAPAHVAGKLGA
ncbi:hypothetical protein D9M70_563460 [compost metagenome]